MMKRIQFFIGKFLAVKKNRLVSIAVLAVLLAAAAGAILLNRAGSSSGTQTPSARTARVVRGDLTSTITGTGKLISENEESLAFSTGGVVETLNVKVGQQVKKGDVLAALKDTEKLSLEVENKELALQQAEKAVHELEDSAELNLAQGLADRAAAEEAYDLAKKNLITKGQPRCDKNVTEQYYYDYMYARHDYEIWNSYLIDGGTGYGTMYIQERLAPYKQSMLLNYANWKYCEGYTELERQESEANLEVAKAAYEKAAAAYDELLENGGVDPLEMSILEARRNDADRALAEAKENLANATLIAPFDGVITAVNGVVGLTFEKGAFIEIADIENEVIQTSIEETDLQSFKEGCLAEVVFTTHKDQTYTGEVVRVDPSLTTWFDTTVAQGWVKLSDPLPESIKNYSLGLDASVNITCVLAQDALLAPVEAVLENSSGSYVTLLDQKTGETSRREVEVGKSTTTYAEIISGLQEGELVVIGQGK